MSVSHEQDSSTRNLTRQSHPPAARDGTTVKRPDDIAARSLAALLDTVATADASFLDTLFEIVDQSPAWSPHLWALRQAAEACDEPDEPARYGRAWAWSRELEKLLAHPDQHPAGVIVCHQPLPLLRLCAARLKRAGDPQASVDPEAIAALRAVHNSLSRLVAIERRAARRRQERTAGASQPAATPEEMRDALG